MTPGERRRFFSFSVHWYGNTGNEYLTKKLKKEVDTLLQKFAEKHPGVGNITKISKIKSSGMNW